MYLIFFFYCYCRPPDLHSFPTRRSSDLDQLRRAMAAWKRKGDAIVRFGEKLIAGMLANGFDRGFAERCFEQIKGFSEYGDRKSTRLNSSHLGISYAVFCLKKKKNKDIEK